MLHTTLCYETQYLQNGIQLKLQLEKTEGWRKGKSANFRQQFLQISGWRKFPKPFSAERDRGWKEVEATFSSSSFRLTIAINTLNIGSLTFFYLTRGMLPLFKPVPIRVLPLFVPCTPTILLKGVETQGDIHVKRVGQCVRGQCRRYSYQRQTFGRRALREEADNLRQEQRQKDCRTLNLPEDCRDESQVRDAYIKLAKLYHPDGQTTSADADKFQEVDMAYKNLLKDFANFRHNRHKVEGEYGLYYEERDAEEEINKKKQEEEESPDIKHTAPQHRQYLTFDGVGSGTPFEREKQYDKYRRAKAADNVMEYRVQQVTRASGEKVTAIAKDTKASKKIKTGIGVERLVEDLIQESMARGDFSNLSGQGKPLNQSSNYNPYVDFTTHKLNQVLIDNGFAPEWILLEKEIREEIRRLRRDISYLRHKYGPVLTQVEEDEWNCLVQEFKEDCDTLNKMIFKFNLTVPSLHKQMMTFQLDRASKKALSTFSPEIQESVKNVSYKFKTNSSTKENSENRPQKSTPNESDSFLGFVMSIFSKP